MNLYIFNETRYGAIYGVGTYIRELTAALKNSEINICLIHLFSDSPKIYAEEIDGIMYWFFPAPVSGQQQHKEQWEIYHRNIVYLLQLHIQDKKNLIFHLNYNQKGQLAEELKKVFDCRIVVTVHYLSWCLKLSGNVTRFRKILASEVNVQLDDVTNTIEESYQLEKTLFEKADHIICLSENTRQVLQVDYQIEPDKIAVIYNGLIDSNSISDKLQLRQKYHIPDVPVILFAGRLDEAKGLTFAIRAFKKVLNRNNCHFIIAGNGVFDLFMKECEGIWMHVTWTGMISKECLYDLYSIADIGILPSLSEQCNYVAIEMMMHGLPIIMSAAPGLAEMTEDGISSLQVPVTEYPDKVEIDTDLLAEKMLYLLQNPDERQRLGSNARKRYEEVYTMDVFRKNMIAFYQSIYE